jgi:hypothetical protein
LSALAVLIALLPLPPVAGDAAAAESSDALPDSVLDTRIRFIETRLEASRQHGQIWYWSWMAVNAGSVVGLGIAAGLTNDHDAAVNNAVSAGVAALGVADLVLRPLDARLGAAPIAHLPEATHAEKLAKLERAEAQLRANAARAEDRTSVALHAANLGVATASGVIVGVLGRPRDAAISSAANLLGGIAYLLTQPAGPAEDWRAYQALVSGQARAPAVEVRLSGSRQGAGLALALSW